MQSVNGLKLKKNTENELLENEKTSAGFEPATSRVEFLRSYSNWATKPKNGGNERIWTSNLLLRTEPR